MKRRHAVRGFTLVELMIALVAGSFAVAGVYYLNGMSSRMYGEQMRVSETQMSLRSAMEQLRREFARAGYLHTISTNVTPDCSGAFGVVGASADAVAPRELRALKIVSDGSMSSVNSLLAPTINKTRADLVDVWANFATSDAYLADSQRTIKGPTETTIAFQTLSESFRRSFFDPNLNGINPDRFEDAFKGRMLRIEHEGRTFFRDIVSVDPTALTVNIGNPPWCFEPSGWTAVSPVVHYRYQLEPDTQSDELKRLLPQTPSLGSSRPLLVRREYDADDKEVPKSSHVVLDYAVEFSVDAYVDTAAAAPPPAQAAAPVLALVRGGTAEAKTRDDPQQLRSLILTLSSRSAEADPNLPFIQRSRFGHATLLASPLLTFRVIEPAQLGLVLNARVRTLRSEINLPNL